MNRSNTLPNRIRAATREALLIWRSSTFWLIVGAVAVTCAFIGPFGTVEAFPFAFGLIYWGVLSLIGSFFSTLFTGYLMAHGWQSATHTLGLSVLFGALMCAAVLAVSQALLVPIQSHPGTLLLIFYSLPSATFIHFVVLLVMNQAGQFSRSGPSGSMPQGGQRPAVLQRVPELPEATTVWALSAQDHYVRVVTDAGAALTLSRLADAMRECEGVPGCQIHRSHWVALAAIQNTAHVRRDELVELPTGETLPVSKSRKAALLALIRA